MDENGTQTWTLYDPSTSDPIMDFNGSGSLETRYLWGPTGIVARESSGGTVAWYLADALGTVRDVINNSGTVIDHVDYSAFGTVLDESNPTSGDRFVSFAGLERDTVTGLNLAVEREENPGTGRWDSQDPLGFGAGDPNLYRYVGNTPQLLIDPEGLIQIPTHFGNFVDMIYPGYVKLGPEFKPQGGPWFNQRPLDDTITPSPLPPKGKYEPTDGLWTPAGFLKISATVTVYLVGSCPDGRPIFYSNGKVEWYPAGSVNPWNGDNPASPQTETGTPKKGDRPMQPLGPNWPFRRPRIDAKTGESWTDEPYFP
jgi:RHS repeat-associated protein